MDVRRPHALNFRFLLIALYLILAIYGIIIVRNVIAKQKQWDFRSYYLAAKVFSEGRNPYSLAELSAEAGEEIRDPYVYPPFTLYVFQPLASFNYKTCSILYLALKVISLIFLVWLWNRYFLDDRRYFPLLILFIFFSFHEAVIRDLNSGNISIFEQVLLWSGAVFFLKRKFLLYALFVVIIAQFKLTALILLGLLLVDHDKESIISGIAALIVLAIVNVSSFYATPALFKDFVRNAAYVAEVHNTAPSMMVFIKKAVVSAGENLSNLSIIIFGGYAILLIAFVYLITRKIAFKKFRIEFIMLAFMTYALLLPRFKVYSYIILIVPALFIVRKAIPFTTGKIAAVVLICVSFFPYQQWLTLVILFAIYIIYLQKLKDVGFAT